jgi:general secretion pathway protein A
VDDALKSVLVDFGVAARAETTRGHLASASRQELTAAIGGFAASLAPLQASAAVIVDEAQNASEEIIEALVMLTATASPDRKVHVILAGQPELQSVLHRKPLQAAAERVGVRSRLEPLTAEELPGYVVHRLAIAGANNRAEFDERAFAELYAVTGGVPRLINLVCDAALSRGHELSASVIDEKLIAAAAASLELLPLHAERRQVAGIAAMAAAFLALMLLGAAAAAWFFRARLDQLLFR